MKKILSGLFLVVIAFLFVGCGTDYAELLETFLIETPNPVTSDFVLDSKLTVGDKSYDLKWTSSDESYAKIADTAVDDTYTVSITRPEGDSVNVTLTVKLGDQTKDFTIVISAFGVNEFSDNYDFPQNKGIVYSEFDLDTEFTYNGKTCTISWESGNEDLITISEDGKKAIVVASSVKTRVYLFATFEYEGKTVQKRYETNVYTPLSDMEKIVYWYNNTGISQELSGYVISIGTKYSETYGNISLYMVDDTLKAGYYVYRVKCDQATADKLVPGAHVVVTGATNTLYNGLMETNQDGNIVVDDKPAIDINTTVYALDDDFIAGLPTVFYRESSLVSLTGWKITKKVSAPVAQSTKTLLEVERDGATMQIDCSKYLEGCYMTAEDDAVFNAITAKYNALNVGDYINITGILGCYNGNYQIHVMNADTLTVGTAPTETSIGVKIGAALTEANIPTAINAATSLDLLASKDDVTITWALSNEYFKTAKVENGKLVATPTEIAEKVNLVGTFKCGTYETEVYFTITIVLKAEEEKPVGTLTVAEAKALKKGSEATIAGTVVATGDRGFMVYDGTDSIYVYNRDYEDDLAVGDCVEVKGTLDFYNVIELVPTSYEVIEGEAKYPVAKEVTGAQMDAYVTGTEFANELITMTGELTITEKGYYNVKVEGATVATGSLSYPSVGIKTILSALDGTQVTVTGYSIGHSSNTFYNVMVVSVNGITTIKNTNNMPKDTPAVITGLVAAVSQRGFVLTDGEASTYVYQGSSYAKDLVIGDFVKVTGKVGYYNVIQFSPDSYEKVTLTVTEQEAVVMTSTEADAYISDGVYPVGKITIVGTLSVGDYINLTVDGATVATGSLSYVTEEQKTALAALDGKVVTITGYTVGMSGGKYVNIMVIDATEYVAE